MSYGAKVMELTTETEKLLQQVEMEEENEHGKRPESSDSSTITTTNTSSSSSFSGFHGEHDEVNNGNVYLDGLQGLDDHESETSEHLNEEKKMQIEKGSSSEDNTGSREIDEVQDGDIPEEVEMIEEEEEVDIEDVKDYKAKELLENQKTPDLLCPKCRNCITKVVVLKKRVVVKRIKRKNPPVGGPIHIPVDPPSLGSVDSQPPPAGDIPDQSFLYRCLSCLCIFKSPVADPKLVPDSESVEGVNIQPKPHAKVDFNCLRGVFGFKEPDVQQVPKSHDPIEDVNDEASVQGGQQSLVPSAVEEPTQKKNNKDGPSAVVRLFPIKRSPPDSRVDIPPLSVHPLPQTPDVPLLTPPVVEGRKPEILKSIVYGGLTEAITSLGVISSAAGSGASTLNILVLGLANLFSGLILIIHNLKELREEEPISEATEDNQTSDQEESRYKRLLGRRENFFLHATIAILSFIITGLLPPVVYYFSFRETHNKDYKVASVFSASLICISFLALAKAHVSNPRGSYPKTVLYYATNAVSVSGITYVVGNVVNQLLEEYGWSDGSETPVGEMMLSLMGRKAGGFGYSSSY